MSLCKTLDNKLILDKKINDSKLGNVSNCQIDILNFDKGNKLYVNDNGRKIFQPNFTNWSYLYLGTIAFTKENSINNNNILSINQSGAGTIVNG